MRLADERYLLGDTIARWGREGLLQDVSPEEHFGTSEIVRIVGDYTLQIPEQVVEEGDP